MKFLADIAIILGAATLGGMVARMLRRPPVVGYLVAGAVLGLAGRPFISSQENVETAAEWGVVLLMFAVGVEFSLKSLQHVRRIAVWCGLLKMILTGAAGTGAALLFGLSLYTSIFLGCIVSISSTMMVLKLLEYKGQLDTHHGRIMLGILIVEDLAVVVMAAILPALRQPAGATAGLVMLSLLKALVFLAAAMLLASRGIPLLLRWVVETRSRELFVLTVVAVCLAAAIGTERLGFSLALGAFIAGLIVCESDYSHAVLAEVIPLRDLFASVFFVSMGLLLRPEFLAANWRIALALLAVIVVVKPLVTTALVLAFGQHGRIAVIAGLGLAQTGEFSFVLAQMGVHKGLVGHDVYALTIVTAIVAAALSPFVLDKAPRIYEAASRTRTLHRLLNKNLQEPDQPQARMENHAIICGFGRVGAQVGAALTRHNLPYVVIDYDHNTVHRLRSRGIPAIYGDASNPRVLDIAHPERAVAAAIAIPDAVAGALAVRHFKEVNPGMVIIARAHSDFDLGRIYAEGAEEVIQGEFETGLEMIRHMLHHFGLPLSKAQAYVDDIRSGRYHFPETLGGGDEVESPMQP